MQDIQHREKEPLTDETNLTRDSVDPAAAVRFTPSLSRLVSLRHHYGVWFVPAILLLVAVFPWPYGFYIFLRLGISIVGAWLAYEQWKHDDAVSGWVVALGAIALLYNPLIPIHLTREIWSVLNIATAGLFVGHFFFLRRLVIRDSHRHPVPPQQSTGSRLRLGNRASCHKVQTPDQP